MINLYSFQNNIVQSLKNKIVIKHLSSFSILFLIILSGCDLFSTRNPESPDDNSVNFPPATAPGILMTNFNQSFQGLNAENYFDCFLKSEIPSENFQYFPEPNALARYGAIFNQWNALNERAFLLGLKSSADASINPVLIWTNSNYEVMTTDSAIYVGQYDISVNLQKKSEKYIGIARLTLVHSSSGLWYIKTWQDFQINNSDTSKTWSILKAQVSA